MANIGTFTPAGNTVAILAASTAPTPVQINSTVLGSSTYRITNVGNVAVYLGFGTDATTAATNATIPTSGTPTLAQPLLPTATEVFNPAIGSVIYITASTASGSAQIYVTPGEGM